MSTNTSRCCLFIIAMTLAQPAWPQTAAQPKAIIAIRQQRVALLDGEIKRLDSLIESQLDDIVDTLKAVTDSKDSRTKVARMKENTVNLLMKTIDDYARKRAALQEQLRKPSLRLTDEEKRNLIAAFDARVDKRTQQILALYNSMPTPQDYERYKVVAAGWWGTEYQRNEDFEQDRRMTSHSNALGAAIVKQLDASIARLDRQGRALKTQIAATTDPAQSKALAGQLAETGALIAERRQQRAEVLTPAGTATHTIPLKEAMDMDKALQTGINNLRRNFTILFQRYNTYLNELSALHTAEAAAGPQRSAL